MIRLITYSNELCTISRMKCAESARKFGADMVYEYEPHNIDTFFRANNEATLAAERGAGYWLWKPYFINRAVQHCIAINQYITVFAVLNSTVNKVGLP